MQTRRFANQAEQVHTGISSIALLEQTSSLEAAFPSFLPSLTTLSIDGMGVQFNSYSRWAEIVEKGDQQVQGWQPVC